MSARNLYKQLLRYYRFGFLDWIAFNVFKYFRQKEFSTRISSIKSKILIRKNTSDEDAFDQVFTEQSYAHPLLNDFSPKTIIDAGAYVGYSSVFFANKYPDAKILAIEPNVSNFSLLKENTKSYPNIICIKAALWSEPTKLKNITGESKRHWSFRVGEGCGTDSDGEICAVTIPQIMSENGLEAIDILKIDIEGAEKELFSQNYESWIGKCKIIIIELHDRFAPGCSKAFYSAISQSHFNQFIRGENIFIELL